MRIALVVHKFPPASLGGTETYVRDLAASLSGRHEVYVYYRSNADAGDAFSEESAQIGGWTERRVRYTLTAPGRTRLAVFHDSFLNGRIEQSFDRFLRETSPDIVHFHHVAGLSARLLSMPAAAGIPSVMTLHDFWLMCYRSQLLDSSGLICHTPNDPWACAHCVRPTSPGSPGPAATLARLPLAALFRYRQATLLSAARAPARLIAPSRFLLGVFRDNGFPEERLTYIENGVALRRFADAKRAPDTGCLRIGYLGTLNRHKGVHILAEAFRGIPSGKASLRIFGDTSLFPSYVGELRCLLEGTEASLEGRLESDQIGAALAECDILVVPSLWYENSPVVIQEAFACGVPVVASDLGALPERVRDGVDAMLFKPGDPNDLRSVLMELIENPDLLGRLRSGIQPPRSMTEHILELENLYQSVSRDGSIERTS
ncbi:MAG: glycosyltransferase family 4 protein [Chloroflexota bacterium]|nr:glycosyltransferase family 4 protein [Chloroflexota bacterium]